MLRRGRFHVRPHQSDLHRCRQGPRASRRLCAGQAVPLSALRWDWRSIAAVAQTGKRTKPTPEGKQHRPARKGLYYCNQCKEQFSVQVGTVLKKSHIPTQQMAGRLLHVCASKKGVSAHQLQRQLKVSYKSAWFMAHRIREAMRSGGSLAPPMGGGGIVEADETFIGQNKSYPNIPRRGYQHKHAVLTLVERKGEARSFHIDRADAATIIPIIEENIAEETRSTPTTPATTTR